MGHGWAVLRHGWAVVGLGWAVLGLGWAVLGLGWPILLRRAVVASKLVMCQKAQNYGFCLNTSSGHQRQTEASCNKKLQGG